MISYCLELDEGILTGSDSAGKFAVFSSSDGAFFSFELFSSIFKKAVKPQGLQ